MTDETFLDDEEYTEYEEGEPEEEPYEEEPYEEEESEEEPYEYGEPEEETYYEPEPTPAPPMTTMSSNPNQNWGIVVPTWDGVGDPNKKYPRSAYLRSIEYEVFWAIISVIVGANERLSKIEMYDRLTEYLQRPVQSNKNRR